jgi:hypothetical protein
MTGPDIKVPTHIFYFEVLLYLSLLIDVLSAAFLDQFLMMFRSTRLAVNFIAVLMTLAYAVDLACRPSAQELGADGAGCGIDVVDRLRRQQR